MANFPAEYLASLPEEVKRAHLKAKKITDLALFNRLQDPEVAKQLVNVEDYYVLYCEGLGLFKVNKFI